VVDDPKCVAPLPPHHTQRAASGGDPGAGACVSVLTFSQGSTAFHPGLNNSTPFGVGSLKPAQPSIFFK
jgi:hypothetical protein